jgi:hypothetical protein
MRVWSVEEDQREFAEFYAAAWGDCLRIVMVSVADRPLAEDLVAEGLHQSQARGEPPSMTDRRLRFGQMRNER